MTMSGPEFAALRESSDVTQQAVARQAGVSPRQVGNWEHMDRLSPKMEARARRALQRALDAGDVGDDREAVERGISGPQFRDIRARAHLSNVQLARLLEVSPSTISNWLRDGVVDKFEAHVRYKLRAYLRDESTADASRLEDKSSPALVAELQQIVGILAARLAEIEGRTS